MPDIDDQRTVRPSRVANDLPRGRQVRDAAVGHEFQGDGQVVAGSLSDAVQTRDTWTFRRDTGSRDPNWLLIETDEEE